MKNHEIDAPVSVLRRKLMLGLPSGLAMTSPLALLACGGGGDSTSNDTPTDVAADVPLGPDSGVATSTARVTVEWPAGATRPSGALRLVGSFGSTTLANDAADIEILGDGPDLVTLYSSDDKALLTGFVGKGSAVLSPLGTVSTLLHYALGLNFASAVSTSALQSYLAATPQATALAATFSALLAADPAALNTRPKALTDALVAARDALSQPAPAAATQGRARPLGLTVQPVIPAANVGGTIGLSVEQGKEFNTVFVRNDGMRRAVYEVRQEGWYDDQNVFHVDRKVVAVDDVPMPKAFDSFGNTLAGWAESYWSGGSAWGGEGEFFQSQTEPVSLPLAPDTAKKTKYSVFVFTPGINHIPEAEYSRLQLEELAYIRGGDLSKNLHWRVMLEDFAVPFLIGLLSGAAKDEVKGAYKDLVASLVETIGAFVKDRMPELANQLGEGKLSPWDAFVQFAKAMTIDPRTFEMSPFLKAVLGLVAKVIAVKLKGDTGRKMFRLIQSGGKRGASIFPVMKILESVDGFLGGAATARLVKDSLVPYEFFAWEVMATKAKVRLAPDPLEVDALSGRVEVTVQVVDNDNDDAGKEVGPITYDWVCTGKYGSLHKRAAGGGATDEENVFTSSKDAATHEYIANGEDKATAIDETITVKAYYGGVNTPGRALIGSVSVPVKFRKQFNLSISPAEITTFPTDTDMVVTAFFKEKLPSGSMVAWEWSHAGAGSLASIPADSNPADSKTKFLSGSAEGTATITARATVNVPAAAGKAPYVVITDPVSMNLQVKKGLKTITFLAGGGVFGCTDPKACGVSEYTAFVVPRFDKAVLYRAVLSGYAYASCNRSVTWNSVVGDGGGCNFPVTYFPHSSAGATDSWAVWIGFGGAFSGKCEVTVTLAP